MLWETLHLFTFVLHCWAKIRLHRLQTSVALLEQYLSTSGLYQGFSTPKVNRPAGR